MTSSRSKEQNTGVSDWIELTNPTDFKRLLYPSPVCFLTVVDNNNNNSHADDNKNNHQESPRHNVMILSWLAAIDANDDNYFIFSMNRRRHTASLLSTNQEFCLSVPVQGTEAIVLQVGGTSGRWGKSKFECDHPSTVSSSNAASRTTFTAVAQSPEPRTSSKRAQKRARAQSTALGIPNLRRIGLGQQQLDDHNTTVFAIDGTIAHLHCQIIYKQDAPHQYCWIDDDHYFFLAHIKQAFVRESYWDSTRHIFAPSSPSPQACYLSFFGSQMFGVVHAIPPPTISDSINSSIHKTISSSSSRLADSQLWIHLKDGKKWSRLLYTNALCLLTTTTITQNDQPPVFDNSQDSIPCQVVSWLTATNNDGAFMFAMDKQALVRTAILHDPSQQFTLSIPVQGMEDWIKTMLHKDLTDSPTSSGECSKGDANLKKTDSDLVNDSSPSRNAISLEVCRDSDDGSSISYISGCIAILQCKVTNQVIIHHRPSLVEGDQTNNQVIFSVDNNNNNNNNEDSESSMVIVFAQVESAIVHQSYWDETRSRFVPRAGCLPYLKQLGSGVFGYVIPSSCR